MSSDFAWNNPWSMRDHVRSLRRAHSEDDSSHHRGRDRGRGHDRGRGRGGRGGREHWHQGGFGPPGGWWGGMPPMPPMPPGAPMPPYPPGGPGMHFGRRGRKARRGDVRAAILALLAEGPM
ncbi:MAG: PadR family transcriptional regulator, partial [Stackebrandtia sp.]